MKNKRPQFFQKYPFALIFGLLLFSSGSTLYSKSSPNDENFAKHVIVLGIDGLSPDGIRTAKTPVLDLFMNGGAYSLHARAVMPTNSGPNWGSMIMGSPPEQHGILDNDWSRTNFLLPPVATRNENLYPTMFAVIRDQRPDAEIGAILDWNPIIRFIEEDVLSFQALPSNEDDTAVAAAQYIREKKPFFTFIHIDHVDGAGHRYGHGSAEYYLSVEKADSLIGEIVRAVEDAGMYDDTIFILSSDHGGVGFGHGGNTLDEMEIPFLVYGKGVKPNHLLRFPINVYDVAVTAVYALGLDIPYEWTGRPVKAAFEWNEDPVLHYTLNHLNPAPIILPEGDGFAQSGGLFIGEPALMRIKNPSERGEIRFTRDGSMPSGSSELYREPIELRENVTILARIFEGERPVSDVSRGYFRFIDNPDGKGLFYRTYLADGIRMLADFEFEQPVSDGMALEISSELVEMPRRNDVAVLFEGFIEIPRMGRYLFYLSSDDGSRLFINGNEIVNNDGDHGVITRSGAVILTENRHHIRVEWFNAGGGYWLETMIEGPGLPRQVIPASWLFSE
ncbi:MAG: hypothetical protein EA360_06055 [Balneolaceae bacterium]|nr:MAG: hypothetical protein EA360_06055 [Balneolaceae bacterium]